VNTSRNHVPDHELLMAVDGELPEGRAGEVGRHLASCWSCRTRLHELEEAIAGFVHAYGEIGPPIPPADGPRALLTATMRHRVATGNVTARRRTVPYWFAAAVVAVAIAGAAVVAPDRFRSGDRVGDARETGWLAGPDPTLTPGATAPVTDLDICSADPGSMDPSVSSATGRIVFAAYGIRNPQPGAYELDYLISPELGGSNDVSNLWPQPYSEALWSARVKDALEDHLQQLVCDGEVPLRTAQNEIAEDWVSAYKKHFDTEVPIAAHRQFVKDEPWTR
jgi:hypothetical protein